MDDRSGTDEWAWDKAMFCLKTGIQPSEYDALTDEEIVAFVEAWNDLNKSK